MVRTRSNTSADPAPIALRTRSKIGEIVVPVLKMEDKQSRSAAKKVSRELEHLR